MRKYRTNEIISKKTDELDELAMALETAVIDLASDDYLNDFFNFYRIKNKGHKLIPSEEGFETELSWLCSTNRYRPVYEKAIELFGEPERVMRFEDKKPVLDELENGGKGRGPFFFIFDLIFCEYDGFVLCFISGSNN